MSTVRLFLLVAFLCPFVSSALAASKQAAPTSKPILSTGSDHTLFSSRTGVRYKSTTGPDTFYLYGGPDTIEGKFQGSHGGPGTLGHAPHDIVPGEWFGVDLTEQPQFWQVSTFCAESLDGDGSSGGTGDGPGNLAWWAGRSATQEPGWGTPPGYGNHWNAKLKWHAPMLDLSVGQTVELSFAFHYDVEPIWDFFNVAYDSANTVKWVYSVDGSNTPFDAPGVQYPADVNAESIVYAPHGYPFGEQISLRLVVISDGAWSDEDGLWPTTCGAAIVDDIIVRYTDGVQQHVDFSDVDNTNSWQPPIVPYVGDFSRVFPSVQSIDPCLENPTPMVGFIDDGRCPQNGFNNAGEPPCESTGGTLMLSDPYGLPGGWAVNYTGGLTFGIILLANDVWSPPIAWDLPGPEDDGPEVAGAKLRFSVWRDLSLAHGAYYVWRVRTSHDHGATWSDFVNDNWYYFGSIPRWVNAEIDVTQYLNAQGPPTHVQLALGASEAELIEYPTYDPTPSPLFDNVALLKYRVGGPVIAADEAYTFMDAFPQSGNADFATLAGRQNSDCRLDVRDVNTGMPNTPGDSMIVDVVATIPNTTVEDVRAVWVLEVNPWFDDARVLPPGATVNPDGSYWGVDQWLGESPAHPIDSIENRYWIGLLDEDFLHPGDQLRYHVRATDSEGNVSTLPADLDAFDFGYSPTGQRYDPAFTVRGLPSVSEDGPGSFLLPPMLVVNALGTHDMEELHQALEQNGGGQGVWYDIYSVRAPGQSASNGIGSSGAHGATAEQLSGYEVILYTSGSSLRGPSDGSNSGRNDKSDDIGVLTSWFQQDAKRAIAHFGDNVVHALMNDAGSAGISYAQDILGVDFTDHDVSDEIGQTTPLVVPQPEADCFAKSFVAYGGCPSLHTFDSILPRPGAVASHAFASADGTPLAGPAAGTLWLRTDGNGMRKSTAVFPYGLESVWDLSTPEPSAVSRRAILVQALILGCFERSVFFGQLPVATEATTFIGVRDLMAGPNPFNPTTVVSFQLGTRTHVVVRLFDVRGQLVRTLHDGRLEAGLRRFPWRGDDDHGVPVASGIYVARVEADGHKETIKIALIK